MTQLILISHPLCPYVQRAAIALTEKQTPFQRVYVDLAAKPDWFRVLSPLGKVPVLQVTLSDGKQEAIFESAVILEYLEETLDGPLHPVDPIQRARHRGWIEFGSAMLNSIARLYGAKELTVFDHEAAAISAMADRIEGELERQDSGPYFAQDRFSLVDAVFGPVFRYFDTFEAVAGLRLLDNRPRLAAWRTALAIRPSVRDAVLPDYAERLTNFLRERNSVLSGRLPV